MHIGILHGWLLKGSGSNIYTQNVVRHIWAQEHHVDVFCQDSDACKLPFVARVRRVGEDGALDDSMCHDHGVTINIPDIGNTLPVFVPDIYPAFRHVVEFTRMSIGEIERYIRRNVGAVCAVHKADPFDVLHANHAIMMPVVARRVMEETGVPYLVTLHGSGLVYAVERDTKLFEYAVVGLGAATRVVVGNRYFRDRVVSVFKEALPRLDEKVVEVPLGVDTGLFRPHSGGRCGGTPGELGTLLGEYTGGRSAAHASRMTTRFSEWARRREVPPTVFDLATAYSQKSPDEDTMAKLDRLDWGQPVVMFVGRLIPGKGPHDLVLAFMELTETVPAQLIVVGAGPLREWLEALAWCWERGKWEMIGPLLDTAVTQLGTPEMFAAAYSWLRDRGTTGLQPVHGARICFTGFMDHSLLRHLLPCADVAVFPSLVPESFGLVTLEAAACGVVPLVTDFSGLRDSAVVLEREGDHIQEGGLRFRREPEGRIHEIAGRIVGAIQLSRISGVRQSLRTAVEEHYSWQSVAKRLTALYREVCGGGMWGA